MSAKSLFKGLGKKKPARSLEEITKEYNEVRARVADTQYHVYVYQLETEKLNKQMYALNQEASERQKLDAETKAKEKGETNATA